MFGIPGRPISVRHKVADSSVTASAGRKHDHSWVVDQGTTWMLSVPAVLPGHRVVTSPVAAPVLAAAGGNKKGVPIDDRSGFYFWGKDT